MESPTTVCIESIMDRVTRVTRFFGTLVIHPTATFQQIRDLDAWTVLRWYLVAVAFYTTMVTGLAYSGLSVTVPPTFVQMVIGDPPMHPSASLPPVWLIAIVGNYGGTALKQSILIEITIWALWVVFGNGASRGFGQTFKAITISHVPWLVLGWIPLVGFIASVPMLLYQVIGLRELHQISTQRAIVAVFLIPALLLCSAAALLGGVYTYTIFLSPHT